MFIKCLEFQLEYVNKLNLDLSKCERNTETVNSK